MPIDGPDPNNAIRRFSTTVAVYPSTATDTVGDSVYSTDDFGQPTDIRARIRAADPADHTQDELGERDAAGMRLYCVVPVAETAHISVDDSVDYDGQAWRVSEREPAPHTGFERFRLLPDPRRTADQQA